jgi:hypothetical protein
MTVTETIQIKYSLSMANIVKRQKEDSWYKIIKSNKCDRTIGSVYNTTDVEYCT